MSIFDPIWSERASPVEFAGPRRIRPPGIRFEDLPRIHGVLITHNHYDRLDRPTLLRLAIHHEPRFFVPLGNAVGASAAHKAAAQAKWRMERVIPLLPVGRS